MAYPWRWLGKELLIVAVVVASLVGIALVIGAVQ